MAAVVQGGICIVALLGGRGEVDACRVETGGNRLKGCLDRQ